MLQINIDILEIVHTHKHKREKKNKGTQIKSLLQINLNWVSHYHLEICFFFSGEKKTNNIRIIVVLFGS